MLSISEENTAGCLVLTLPLAAYPPQVICEKADRTDIPTIDKKKYLVPSVSISVSEATGHALLV